MSEKASAIKAVFKASPDRLAIIFGWAMVLLAFCNISRGDKWAVAFPSGPNWYLLPIGIVLLLVGAVVCILRLVLGRRERQPTVLRVEEGVRLALATNQVVDVLAGDIAKVEVDETHGAVVLPVNTAFDDECMNDERSAIGAYLVRHFPNSIPQLRELIEAELAHLKPERTRGDIRSYPVGTTVLLDKPLQSTRTLMLVAVTRYGQDSGISADTSSVVQAVQATFRRAASHRMSSLFLPVLGTGHGGLDFEMGLAFLLLQSIHCMRSEQGHHVKKLTIVYYDSSGEGRAKVESLVNSIAVVTGKGV